MFSVATFCEDNHVLSPLEAEQNKAEIPSFKADNEDALDQLYNTSLNCISLVLLYNLGHN